MQVVLKTDWEVKIMGEKKFDFKAVVQDAGRNASKKLGKAKDAVG